MMINAAIVVDPISFHPHVGLRDMRLGFGKQGILLGLRNVGAVQAGTGQTFEDDRQFLLPSLVHQQIHAVIRQHAGLIGLADALHQQGVHVLKVSLAFDFEQQMVAHMVVFEVVGSQHLRQERFWLQQVRSRHQHGPARHVLVFEGPDHGRFDQTAHDAEQILEVQVHLVRFGLSHGDDHGQFATVTHADGVHREFVL